ncbi:MAG: acylphosphatase, partial [Oscillospiraceae bacterium]|nr:acylphosphatase [Oscillospiraceae bacterium]
MIRKQYEFEGNVQGVGFRYRCVMAARALGITGWVENQWDGSVL